MSESIVIEKSGTAEVVRDVEAIRTDAISGSTIRWVPEESTKTEPIIINENGKYTAADNGILGYSSVIVAVEAGSVTGKGEDGNEYTVKTNEDGEIVKTKTPSSISITTSPSVTTYNDGDTIDYTGIVVTSYDANGGSMGVVPYASLSFPVKTANSGQTEIPVQWSRDGDGKTLEDSFSISVAD